MINLSRLGVFATLILASSLFFITAAAADSCDTDPERCTPAKLCEKTTETLDDVIYWISDESNAFLKTARKFGLDCKAKDPLSPCERNADLCSIVELCEIATSEIENKILWDTKRYEHVSLAKEFGLQCDVNDLSTQNLTDVAFVNCNANISQCSDVDICLTATFQSAGTTSWRFGGYKKFVDEAKRRGLSCDVIKPNSPENVAVLADVKILPKKRKDPNRLIFDIVKAADNGETCQLTVNVTNNTSYDFDYISSRLKYMDKYGAEINRVLLDGKEIVAGDYVQWRSTLSKPCADINSASLGEVVYVKVDGKFNFQLPKIISKQQILYSSVPSLTVYRTTDGFNVKKPKIKSTSKSSLRCDEDISNCSDVYLCLSATFKSSGTTKWKTSSDASKFIDEAKRRGISCGVASTSSVDAPKTAKTQSMKPNDPGKLILELVEAKGNSSVCTLKIDVKNNTKYDFSYVSTKLIFLDREGAQIDKAAPGGAVPSAGITSWGTGIWDSCDKLDTVILDGIGYTKIDDKIDLKLPKKLSKKLKIYSSLSKIKAITSAGKLEKTCSDKVENCSAEQLCNRATVTINGVTSWKVGEYLQYVIEAKRRGMLCGVASSNSAGTLAVEPNRYIKWVKELSECNKRLANYYELKDNKIYVSGHRLDVNKNGVYTITPNNIQVYVTSQFGSSMMYFIKYPGNRWLKKTTGTVGNSSEFLVECP